MDEHRQNPQTCLVRMLVHCTNSSDHVASTVQWELVCHYQSWEGFVCSKEAPSLAVALLVLLYYEGQTELRSPAVALDRVSLQTAVVDVLARAGHVACQSAVLA
jgi:hypothetical protein